MKILVFGATGYVGSHATRRLISAGHEVTGFVTDGMPAMMGPMMGGRGMMGS